MSNWKVGPGGRLYHPTTGAYVGQLDDNGNEQMVVSAFPSESGGMVITTLLRLTDAEYAAISVKSTSTIYLTNTGSLYVGDVSIGGGVGGTQKFPDFAPGVVASLVAGSTAVQAGNTVTVTATAHGITSLSNGLSIYYPGSPSIPIGWYAGFQLIGANNFSFTNPTAQTVASESVNGGAIFTGTATFCSTTIPGNSVGANGSVQVTTLRSGDSTTSTKLVQTMLGATTISKVSLTSSPLGSISATWFNVGDAAKQRGAGYPDGVASGASLQTGTVDTSVNQTMSIAGSCSMTASHLVIWQANYRVNKVL